MKKISAQIEIERTLIRKDDVPVKIIKLTIHYLL
jgi:hypothetical protein